MHRTVLIAVTLDVAFFGALADAAPQLATPNACTGCCSSHGGVSSSCSGGRIMCIDGSTSPSCTCSSCGGTPTPPTCSYSYSAWSPCQSNNTQTRVVTGSSPVGCSGTPGPLSQFCV